MSRGVMELGLSEEAYATIEAGQSPAEKGGSPLAQIAIVLETPTFRFIAESDKSTNAEAKRCSKLDPGTTGRRKSFEQGIPLLRQGLF